jgi:hypothetical protein
VDAILLGVKIIEACMMLYNEKYHHANGNANSQPGNVEDGVIPVTDQTSPRSFKIILKHKSLVLMLDVSQLQSVSIPYHSVLTLFTGFAIAALITRKKRNALARLPGLQYLVLNRSYSLLNSALFVLDNF